MKKMNKKGFTIVELVIVIAVIAILAAVLIPTFSGVVQKANESAALQTATSAMKTVLAQSSSATIADGTYFVVGDKTNGVQYLYQYTNNKIGTDNLHGTTDYSTDSLVGKTATVGTESKTLNTIIIPTETDSGVTTPSDEADTLALIKDVLGMVSTDTLTYTDRPASTATDETSTAVLAAIPANATKYVTVTVSNTTYYFGILTNVDFAEGTIVVTYSK